MSRLKDLMLDVQCDLELIISNKPHLTKNQAIATVAVARELSKREFVDTGFIEQVYNLTMQGGHADLY